MVVTSMVAAVWCRTSMSSVSMVSNCRGRGLCRTGGVDDKTCQKSRNVTLYHY